MFMQFKDWEKEIKLYCEKNGLDFEKAKKSSSSRGFTDICLQHYDPNEVHHGLIDETPAPVTLIIEKHGDGVIFKQTEYTRQYLSI